MQRDSVARGPKWDVFIIKHLFSGLRGRGRGSIYKVGWVARWVALGGVEGREKMIKIHSVKSNFEIKNENIKLVVWKG